MGMADPKAIATGLRDFADQLDPPVVVTPPLVDPVPVVVVPPPPAPSFQGRSTVDPNLWLPHFEEDFPTLVPEGGEFLTKYKLWSAYPSPWPDTSKHGIYEPKNLSVVDLGDGQTALNCRLIPGSKFADGKARVTAACPRFPKQSDGSHLSLKWEQRCRVAKKVKGFKSAAMGWPRLNSAWPTPGGENDFMEMNLDGVLGATFHVLGGGKHGEGQIIFSAPEVDITQWFTVGFELIAGQSYKWFVNGRQVGQTVPANKVPNYAQHIVLQLETCLGGALPTEEANVQIDWCSAWVPTTGPVL